MSRLVAVWSIAVITLLVCSNGVIANDDGFCSMEPTPECGGTPSTTPTHSHPSYVGSPGTFFERTFIAIKPDGVARGLVGTIIKRFEAKGFQLIGMKMVVPTPEQAEEHYIEHKARSFYSSLVQYLTSGPVVAMVWQGLDVVTSSRAMIGATVPAKAAPGTIRADYAVHVGRNLIHGSDSTEAAIREISLWFSDDEVIPYDDPQQEWLYDAEQQ